MFKAKPKRYMGIIPTHYKTLRCSSQNQYGFYTILHTNTEFLVDNQPIPYLSKEQKPQKNKAILKDCQHKRGSPVKLFLLFEYCMLCTWHHNYNINDLRVSL